jgi:hypothetical protein
MSFCQKGIRGGFRTVVRFLGESQTLKMSSEGSSVYAVVILSVRADNDLPYVFAILVYRSLNRQAGSQ